MKNIAMTTRWLRASRLCMPLVALWILPAGAQAEKDGAEPAPQVRNPTGNPGREAIKAKLKTIVLPAVKLEDVSFEEAVDYLRTESKARDSAEQDESKKGVRFLILGQRGTEYPRVSLKLQNVTLGEALDRLTDLSRTSLRIDAMDVTLVPKEAVAADPAPEAVEAAKRTVIPLVDLADEPLAAVVEFLNKSSAEKKGPRVVIGEGVDPKTKVKEIRLREATLAEAVFIVTQQAGCSLKADDDTLRLVPR